MDSRTMNVSTAIQRGPLLRTAACLLVAAETDLRNADTLRSTAAGLQILADEISAGSARYSDARRK
jgi:hypothetical protein